MKITTFLIAYEYDGESMFIMEDSDMLQHAGLNYREDKGSKCHHHPVHYSAP